MSEPWRCETCGGGVDAHSLADAIFCIYGDAETKDGGPLGRDGANEVANRVLDKLWSPTEETP